MLVLQAANVLFNVAMLGILTWESIEIDLLVQPASKMATTKSAAFGICVGLFFF